MNLQQKLERLATVRAANKKVQATTRAKLDAGQETQTGVIYIKEINAFNQVITAVVHHINGRDIIKDMKTGPVCDHTERSARYHANALGQGLITVTRLDGSISHLRVNA
jgi:hypothetical protein